MDWYFPAEVLANSPSRADAISVDLERGYRSKTAWFIEEYGKELKFNRLVVSTAQVLAHRFYVFQSFKQHDRYFISAAALFLASKVEESMMKGKHHLQTMVKAYVYYRKKMNANFDMTLCFDIQINHPYTDALRKIKSLKNYIAEDVRKDFHQVVVNMINDSYRTTLCVQYPPAAIGVGAIFLAALFMSLQPINIKHLSLESTWYELLESDIDEDTLKSICEQMLEAYADASSASSSRVIDPKKIMQARIKLQSCDHLHPYNDSSTIHSSDSSPNTIAFPMSVTHSGSQLVGETDDFKVEGNNSGSSSSNNNNNDNSMNNPESIMHKRKYNVLNDEDSFRVPVP